MPEDLPDHLIEEVQLKLRKLKKGQQQEKELIQLQPLLAPLRKVNMAYSPIHPIPEPYKSFYPSFKYRVHIDE